VGFVQHTRVRNQRIIGWTSTSSAYDVLDDSLKFRTVVLVLTQEMERLLLAKNLAAQVAVSVDAVFDAHAESTEHDCDDAVDDVRTFLFFRASSPSSNIPSGAGTKHEAEIMASKRQFCVVPPICARCLEACVNQPLVTLTLLVTDEFQDPLEDKQRDEAPYTAAICQPLVSCEDHEMYDTVVFLPSAKTDSFL
jgi:hypothetical protein